MNRNWITYLGIFLVLLCCTPSQVKSGGYGEYGERSYRGFSTQGDTDRIFNQIMERRDIRMAINTLIGEGFTSSEIDEAVENRLQRIRRWHFSGNLCSASGNIAEPG